MMITEDSIRFFTGIPPYKFLDEALIKKIAGSLSMEFFPSGSYILTQDGSPSDCLRVIKKGGVKVFISNDDDIVIDYKGEGDSFGYISLVSGDRSRTNVLAVEDTICYIVPKELVMEIARETPIFGEFFLQSFFDNYLDKTYSEMQGKNILFKEGEKLLYTSPVKNLVSGGVISAISGISVQDVAAIMSENRISSLVLNYDNGKPAGIITDRDLRDKVVAKGYSLTTPAREIMSTKLVMVDAAESCFDALAIMIRNSIHHLLVTEGDDIIGVVTNHDFMLMQGTSPLSLLKNIDRQESIEELSEVYSRINRSIVTLFKEGVSAGNILRIITELHDRFINKVIQLSLKESGEPPVPFTFFVYGTEGRREETFKTVFRCGILYEDGQDYAQKVKMEEFCRKLLDQLSSIFKKCGLPTFETSPINEQTPPYGDLSEWEKRILTFLTKGSSIHAAAALKLLDMRAVFGNDEKISELQALLYSKLSNKGLLEIIRPASGMKQKSPVGFFKRFVIDESGEQSKDLDIKKDGIIPIVDSIRALAGIHGIYETSTIKRLGTLSGKGIISDMDRDIRSAFEFMLHLLLQSQLIQQELGHEVTNIIETKRLSVLEKKTLKEVFQIIQKLQLQVKKIIEQEVLPVK